MWDSSLRAISGNHTDCRFGFHNELGRSDRVVASWSRLSNLPLSLRTRLALTPTWRRWWRVCCRSSACSRRPWAAGRRACAVRARPCWTRGKRMAKTKIEEVTWRCRIGVVGWGGAPTPHTAQLAGLIVIGLSRRQHNEQKAAATARTVVTITNRCFDRDLGTLTSTWYSTVLYCTVTWSEQCHSNKATFIHPHLLGTANHFIIIQGFRDYQKSILGFRFISDKLVLFPSN